MKEEVIKQFISQYEKFIGNKTETFEVRGTDIAENFYTAKVVDEKSVVIYVPFNETELVWIYIAQNYDCSLSKKLMDEDLTKFWLGKTYDHKLKEYVFREKSK